MASEINGGGLLETRFKMIVSGSMNRKISPLLQAEGVDFELDTRLLDYFKNKVGLTDDQIELVQGIARRIAHSQRDSGPVFFPLVFQKEISAKFPFQARY